MQEQRTREKFVELRAGGWSYERIAKELRVSKQCLINRSRELQTEIANLRTIELEAGQEQYYMTKCGRIELPGEKLRGVEENMGGRWVGRFEISRFT